MDFDNFEFFSELSDVNEFKEKCMTGSDSVFIWFYKSQEDLVAPNIELKAKQSTVDKRYKMNVSHIPEISRLYGRDYGGRPDLLPDYDSPDGPELPAFMFLKGGERVHLVQGRKMSSVEDGFIMQMAYRYMCALIRTRKIFN